MLRPPADIHCQCISPGGGECAHTADFFRRFHGHRMPNLLMVTFRRRGASNGLTVMTAEVCAEQRFTLSFGDILPRCEAGDDGISIFIVFDENSVADIIVCQISGNLYFLDICGEVALDVKQNIPVHGLE